MAQNLNLFSIPTNEIIVGSIVSKLSRNKYSAHISGFLAIAETLRDEIFETNDHVLIAEISNSYRILGHYRTSSKARTTHTIEG